MYEFNERKRVSTCLFAAQNRCAEAIRRVIVAMTEGLAGAGISQGVRRDDPTATSDRKPCPAWFLIVSPIAGTTRMRGPESDLRSFNWPTHLSYNWPFLLVQFAGMSLD